MPLGVVVVVVGSWDAFLTTNSSAAASSGSRMLSEVYSQALELGGNSFFLDARGERIRGYCTALTYTVATMKH